MAKAALSNNMDYVWRGSYPDFIKSIVLIEQALFMIYKILISHFKKKKRVGGLSEKSK
jgi:hypothetical protein